MTERDEGTIVVVFALISFEVSRHRKLHTNGLAISERFLHSYVNCALSSPYIDSDTYTGVRVTLSVKHIKSYSLSALLSFLVPLVNISLSGLLRGISEGFDRFSLINGP